MHYIFCDNVFELEPRQSGSNLFSTKFLLSNTQFNFLFQKNYHILIVKCIYFCRAEKSKNAAKNRRDKEAVEFNNIIEALPFPNEDLEKMDKSSVVKLTTSYLKMLELIDKGRFIFLSITICNLYSLLKCNWLSSMSKYQ